MNRLCIALLGIVLLYGCQKLNSLTNIPPDNPSPDITAIGSPIGNLVSKTIGSGGGSLTSDDGKVQLTIPASALAVNTDISIQAEC
jgi:hypothetical protein